MISGASRRARTDGSSAGGARVSSRLVRENAEPAERLVGLVANWPGEEQHPAVAQRRKVRKVLLLKLVAPFVRIVRRVGRPAQQDEREAFEIH